MNGTSDFDLLVSEYRDIRISKDDRSVFWKLLGCLFEESEVSAAYVHRQFMRRHPELGTSQRLLVALGYDASDKIRRLETGLVLKQDNNFIPRVIELGRRCYGDLEKRYENSVR